MINVGVKLTLSQQAKWKELGGAKWLREYLCQKIEDDRTMEMGMVLGVKMTPKPAPKNSNKELIASVEKILDDAKNQIKKAVS
jgi:hypothetical protein